MSDVDSNQKENRSEIILYQTEDGFSQIQVRLEEGSVWLTQIQMAELFQTTVPNINLHVKNILAEGELMEKATIKEYLIVQTESQTCQGRKSLHARPGQGIMDIF